jgi:hypothetical protein
MKSYGIGQLTTSGGILRAKNFTPETKFRPFSFFFGHEWSVSFSSLFTKVSLWKRKGQIIYILQDSGHFFFYNIWQDNKNKE